MDALNVNYVMDGETDFQIHRYILLYMDGTITIEECISTIRELIGREPRGWK